MSNEEDLNMILGNEDSTNEKKKKMGRPRSEHYGERWVSIKVLESTKERIGLIKNNSDQQITWNDVVHDLLHLYDEVRQIMWDNMDVEQRKKISREQITYKQVMSWINPKQKTIKSQENQPKITDYEQQNGGES